MLQWEGHHHYWTGLSDPGIVEIALDNIKYVVKHIKQYLCAICQWHSLTSFSAKYMEHFRLIASFPFKVWFTDTER